jgi:hypothetical protein
LVEILTSLADDPARRVELGAFGRRFVSERFSLERATGRLVDAYERAAAAPPAAAHRRSELLSTAVRLSAVRTQGWVHRHLTSPSPSRRG